jgi:Protein of unknown function DUF262
LKLYDKEPEVVEVNRPMVDEQAEELDFGSETPEHDVLRALEEKYRDQMRQIMPQKIELPVSTLPQMIEKQINLNPDFQRRGRWDQERRSRFIESLIMNVPIPPVFLGEDEYGSYVVLDGRQRLTAIYEFLRNTFELKGLTVWEELNGNRFDDMEKKKLDRFLTRRFIPAVVILKESSSQVKYDVFDRLNTGGVIATPMEIRNAIFQGRFTELLRELSANSLFRRLWGIPLQAAERNDSTIYSKMIDLELVLRFFALKEPESMAFPFIDHLSEFMDSRNKLYSETKEMADDDRRSFEWAVKNCWKVLGENAFRKNQMDGQPSGKRSTPLGDAFLISFASVDPMEVTDNAANAIKQALFSLLSNDTEFQKAISTGTNGKGAITLRVRRAEQAVRSALVRGA